MFDPARLCTTARPSWPRQADSIAEVVVLPLVAETSSEPSSRRRERLRQRLGVHAQQQAPGHGGAAGAAHHAAQAARHPGQQAPERQPHAGTSTRRQRGSTVTRAGVRPIGSPSAKTS